MSDAPPNVPSTPAILTNVKSKLSAPAKKSQFEKARLEAEEKRRREEAETAAVYKDFVASFDDDPNEGSNSLRYGNSSGTRGGFGGGGFRGGAAAPLSGPGRRHFTSRGGMGGPPQLQPPIRKRNLDSAFDREDDDVAGVFGGGGGREKRRPKEEAAFERPAVGSGRFSDRRGGDDSDDEVKPVPKPTLLLSSLPSTITSATITDLLRSSSTPLTIDNIRITPCAPPSGPSQPPSSIRKSATAIVILSSDTPAADIDSAVSDLKGRYIGSGFHLNIARHLSSTVGGNTNLSNLTPQSHPFGAKTPPQARGHGPAGMSRSHGPHRGGFAPPQSFAPPGSRSVPARADVPQVHVHPPGDLKMLKLIHRTVENVLRCGPEFEALLMSNPAVRDDPKFSWLWDARSPEGVYYRWKLWDLITGYSVDKTQTAVVDVFEGGGVGSSWIPPKRGLKYEWAGSLDDVVEDEGFMSDELIEDDSEHEEEGERPVGLAAGTEGKKRGCLGVLERAKLIHLICRIPTTTREVRRGDIARVMAFAMEHAEGGMGEEIVDILVSNVLQPLVFTSAAKSDSEHLTTTSTPSSPQLTSRATSPAPEVDQSASKIIALWLISDVLSNSSLGVRAAWRYRQLFDTALKEFGVFKHLGDVYRNSGWGRMKAEKFRRGVVEGVLEGWEKWCVFSSESQAGFLKQFLEGDEKDTSATAPKEKETEKVEEKKQSRWKAVDAVPSKFTPVSAAARNEEDVDGEPMPDDEDIDGEPMPDDDIDGVPMPTEDDDVDGEPMPEEEEEEEAYEPPLAAVSEEKKPEVEKLKEEEKKMGFGGFGGMKMGGFKLGAAKPALGAVGEAGKRKRPRAEDMFADSDGE